MNPTQALSDDEIDALDVFLMSEEMPENCMDISTLDGFFAAIVLNPKLIMPNEYLPWIWDMEEGEEGPAFESLEQANYILQLLMRYYNSVLESVSNDDFAPLFYTLEQEDGSEFFDAEGWCEGFMCGVLLFADAWQDILENHAEFLAPMVLLGTEQGWEELERSEDNMQVTQDAYESISVVVGLMYDHFTQQRETESARRVSGSTASGVRVEPIRMPIMAYNVGSNEACPCGSGKKFKKCCGVPPTLH
jgi:uncharacterized protein